MTIKKQSVEDLLGYNKFNADEKNLHIVIDKALCAKCQGKPCLVACPAVLYRQEDENSEVTFDHLGCLECGTCRIVCHNQGNKGIVKWVYPGGNFGISYRYG